MHPRLKAHIVHRIPGRVRIQIPAARHQDKLFASLKSRLNALHGVRSVTVNPASASVTIEHDRNLDPLDGWAPALQSGSVMANACPCCGASAGSNTVGHSTEFDLVSVMTKLLPMVLPKHPIVQVAELVAEPLVRAILGSGAKQHKERTVLLPHAVASSAGPLSA